MMSHRKRPTCSVHALTRSERGGGTSCGMAYEQMCRGSRSDGRNRQATSRFLSEEQKERLAARSR
jgi:hypothetical protein